MRRALIVDDHAANLYLLRALLASNGYEVDSAANGQEALAHAAASRPDLIVSDILMPVMDGFTFCRICRQDDRLKAVPFVFYTATYTDPADERLALSAGADLYLVKPLEPQVFIERIREVVGRDNLGSSGRDETDELDDVSYLKEYSGALVRKLEDKVSALEAANRALIIKEFAIASSPSGILLAGLDMRISWANEAAAVMTGRPPGALAGPTLEDVFRRSAHWKDAAQAIAAAGQWAGELDAVGSGADARTVDARVNTVTDSDGRPLCLMMSIEDVTEERRMAEEVQRGQRLASLSLFAAGVAHDFNNLLGGVFGNIELALDSLPADHKARELLQYAGVAFERARDLTHRLLTFAKGQPPSSRELSAVELLRECGALALAGSGVTFHISPCSHPWAVRGDANQLSRVFTNILVNARQAMAGAGAVRVTLENQETGLESGRCLLVTITDEGPGLSPETLRHLFEPLFTTRPDGTGLGLATCYAIVQAHGGRIEATTAPGRGASFHVYLPAGDAASGAQVAPVSDEGTRSLDRTRVLVMDDEPLVREMVRRMLQGGGCDVVTAESGVQALDVCRRAAQEGRPFDVAILDLTLRGGMGGLEVFERLGEEYPGLPAILSSGYGQPAVESVGRRPAALLPKPYRSHELLACVRSVVSSAGSAGH